MFSRDPPAPRDLFGCFEVSIYGSPTSLDFQAIDRPDGIYDFVICNHVLEHVADDRAAYRELIRILKPTGILQFTVPNQKPERNRRRPSRTELKVMTP